MSPDTLNQQIRSAFVEMAENYRQQAGLWGEFETHMLNRSQSDDFDSPEYGAAVQLLQRKLVVRNMRDQELNARIARLRAERELLTETEAGAK